ncbi:SRPBCC family protein [Mycobacterium colombiense]|uniref:SRPBCC family protein n=1 Tax=Mycobacterium colombiense TaxID=339268 RepID=UPI000949D06B|nr:SRPBCC family protein [Mycobacterium colombiense]
MVQPVTGRKSRRADQAAEDISPLGELQSSLQELAGTLTGRAVSSLSGRLTGATERLTDYVESGGEGGLLAAVSGIDRPGAERSPIKSALAAGVAGASGKIKETLRGAAALSRGEEIDGGAKKSKRTDIIEQIDVGVPVDVAYQQWTQFAQFPKFMKKVEQIEQVSTKKLRLKAKVFLSHRIWEATITEQVPNERIVWRSKCEKGYVDGAVTFHEVAPHLTRVIVVLEYHPHGMFDRAQGRRARLELKNFQRQLMTQAVLHPSEVRGPQGETRKGRAAKDAEKRRPNRGQQRRTPEEIAESGPKQRKAPSRADSIRTRAALKERSRA